jgi:UDP:flavonoid glycosyltransferase YjiC (YdhE family)
MSQIRRKRILFVAEGVTLAHATRPFVLARSLDPAEYEVHFACARRFQFICSNAQFPCLELSSIPSERFLAALNAGKRLYGRRILEKYVRDDLKLMQAVRPEIVVGDFRLSLAVSAQLAAVPHLALANAYWSPYTTRREFPLPDVTFARILGVGASAHLFSLAQPFVFAYHARPLNALRKRYGLKPLGGLLDAYTYGDYTLYTDVPGLFPTEALPSRHRYIGPVLWSPEIPLRESPVRQEKPVIYVTLGSSGPARALPDILAALEYLPVTAMVATAGRPATGGVPKNVTISDYLPGEKLCGLAQLVICNGGSPAVYQALAKGTPVIGIASNLDQFLCMSGIEKVNAGILLRASAVTRTSITDAIQKIMDNQTYRQAASNMAAEIAGLNAAQNFRSVLEEII